MALDAAVLTHNPPGEPLRDQEQGLQGLNSPAQPLRGQMFLSASCLNLDCGDFSLRQQLLLLRTSLRLEESVHLLRLREPLGLLRLHLTVPLLSAVIGQLSVHNDAANVVDDSALGDQLLSNFELADDLVGRVTDLFDAEVPALQARCELSFTANRFPGATATICSTNAKECRAETCSTPARILEWVIADATSRLSQDHTEIIPGNEKPKQKHGQHGNSSIITE